MGFTISEDQTPRSEQQEAQAKELHQQVIERAKMIISRWKDVPSVSSVVKHSVGTETVTETSEE